MSDNIGIGLDVSGFSPDKRAVLLDFISIFEKLEKYDGKTFSPVQGGGLVEFNSSISITNKLLDEINGKLYEFTKVSSTVGSSTSGAAKGTKELTAEQAALKVQTEAVNKALKDQAAAANPLIQSKAAIKKANKEQYDEETAFMAKIKADTTELNSIRKNQTLETQNNIRRANKAAFDEETAFARQQKADSAVLSALKKKEANDTKLANAELIKAQKEQRVTSKEMVAATTEENRVNKVLLNDYALLKLSLQDQAASYANLVLNKGKNAAETKAALATYSETASMINGIDKSLVKAGGSSGNLGVSLTHALGYLRNLAYILPGIGLAGIFDKAFQAISAGAEELGLFNNNLEKELDYQNAVNKSLSENIDLNEKLNKLLTIQFQRRQGGKLSNEDVVDVRASRGVDAFIAANDRLNKADLELQLVTAEISRRGNAPEALKTDLDRRLKLLDDYKSRIDIVTRQIDEKLNPVNKERAADEKGRRRDIQFKGGAAEGVLNPTKETLEKQKAGLQESLKNEQSKFDIDSQLLDQFLSKQKEFFVAQNELAKFNEDEERKRRLEFAKNAIDINISKNEKILNDDISSERQRAAAIEKIAADRIEKARAEFSDTANNRETTPKELEIARDKLSTQITQSNIQKEEDLLDLHEGYRERRFKAISDINKDEVEKEAAKNEAIYKDETKSMEDRLAAYEIFIQKKQTKENIEYSKSVFGRRFESNDPTVKKEILAFGSHRDLQQANVQADAEKQVYDIVYQSLQKQLKLVVEENENELNDNKVKYTNDLKNLRDNFEAKKISYRKYQKELKTLTYEDPIKVKESEILDDKEDINRLEQQLRIEGEMKIKAAQEVERTKDELEFQKATGTKSDILKAQRDYDKAVGAEEATDKGIYDIKLKWKEKEKKLEDDNLALQKLRNQEKIQYEREYAANRKAIIDALFNLVQKVIDGEYQNRIRKIEELKQIQDEQINGEIAAIDKSSLSAKDKAALDIQLNEQKKESDKDAALQEKKLKHEQAVLDRELAVAHILWSTEEAVMNAYASFSLNPIAANLIAAQRGILGAIAVATVLATPIPYKEGTPVGGHPGGLAEYGEDGAEWVKEPYKPKYMVTDRTISYLPKGTQVIPIKDTPEVLAKDDGTWEQTRWLAKKLAPKPQKNKISITNNIDLSFEIYKQKILHG